MTNSSVTFRVYAVLLSGLQLVPLSAGSNDSDSQVKSIRVQLFGINGLDPFLNLERMAFDDWRRSQKCVSFVNNELRSAFLPEK